MSVLFKMIEDLAKQSASIKDSLDTIVAEASSDIDNMEDSETKRELKALMLKARTGKGTMEDAANLIKKYGINASK